MSADFAQVDAILIEGAGRLFPAAQLVVRCRGRMRFGRAYGWLDPAESRTPTRLDTRFDLASVSKLFVAVAFMRLVETGRAALDTQVAAVLPDLRGLRPIEPYEDPLRPGEYVSAANGGGFADAGRVTFRHLLSHSSGLPAWRPLYRQPDAASARRMALETAFAHPVATRTLYSDIGLILLGMAVEALTGLQLGDAIATLVTRPLGLKPVGYRPAAVQRAENVAPTEFCAWRGRRLQGEVHDENAYRLGGTAGHAGLFATAGEAAAFGQLFLDSGEPLLQPQTVAEMTRIQSADGTVRRGLGFALWSPDPEASGNPFSESAFGHTGFTGTSLWIDPPRQLVVALLTNEVYFGRQGRAILPLRAAVHRAVVEAVDAHEASERWENATPC